MYYVLFNILFLFNMKLKPTYKFFNDI